MGRVALAFDLAETTTTMGAPLLRFFLQGREGCCRRQAILALVPVDHPYYNLSPAAHGHLQENPRRKGG